MLCVSIPASLFFMGGGCVTSRFIENHACIETRLCLERKCGILVMLEEMFGCTLISKLRAILLMEADFTFSDKTIFGTRMMNNIWVHG